MNKAEAIGKYLDLIEESSNKYPSKTDLLYKYQMPSMRFNDIIKFKQEDVNNKQKYFDKINLKNETTGFLHYHLNDEIEFNLMASDKLISNSKHYDKFNIKNENILNGFLFSEIEYSLKIEGVRSTRAKIETISKTEYADLKDQNSIIVKNMIEGYNYILDKEINKNTMYELYNILSNECLAKDEVLLPGYLYRHDGVNIIGGNEKVVDKGVNQKNITMMMDMLFDYINEQKTDFSNLLAPHVIHYYLIYIHPYFDYNGRMARVLAFWYNRNFFPVIGNMFISEAINQKTVKNNYYKAITNSREMENDITYFISFLSRLSLEFTYLYLNYYEILETLDNNQATGTKALNSMIITLLKVNKEFNWKEFKEIDENDYNKQYYLKMLNLLVDKDVLKARIVKKAKLFKLNIKFCELYK
ncbi:MAG: Fic family protein [Candidatus Izemoplasma sp.]